MASRSFTFEHSMQVEISKPGAYGSTLFCAYGVGLAQIFIGATLMTILIYCLEAKDFNDYHILLCSFGYHFFIAEGILSMHYANGWSAFMVRGHKRCLHTILTLCGLGSGIGGTVLVLLKSAVTLEMPTSVHGLLGLITAGLMGLSMLFGPCAFYRSKGLKIFHSFFGVPAFILSSVTLCYGILEPTFKEATNDTVIYILLGFISFYTLFTISSALANCVSSNSEYDYED